MFFLISKAFYILINPIIWLIVLLIIAYFIKSKSLKQKLILFTVFILLSISNQALQNFFLVKWEITPMPIDSIKTQYSYAIVLGGMADYNKTTGKLNTSREIDRLIQAIILYKKGKVDTIIITGGSGNPINQSFKESKYLKEYCINLGVPSANIKIEINSRNTYENALYTKSLIVNDSLNRVLLITSGYHMRRSIAIFNRQGYNFDYLATDSLKKSELYFYDFFVPRVEVIKNWATLIKEIVGLAMYKTFGFA